jgi:carboxylesterase
VHPILCLHGFTGTPFDVGALADLARVGGLCVRSPMLPGHGGTVAALGVTGAQDWLSGAEEGLTRLGDETGSASRLSARRWERCSLASVAPAPRRDRRARADVRAAAVASAAASSVEALARMAALFGIARRFRKIGGVDAADPLVREAAPSISAFPLAALRELFALSDAAADDAPSVTRPRS